MNPKTREFRLQIELVPSTVWFSSIYRVLKDGGRAREWQKIKRRLFEKEGKTCYLCGSTGRLEAHEFWEYDGENHVQKLVAIHHLCDMCHKIKHIGFWCFTADGQRQLERMNLTRDDLIDHFCQVNGCSVKEFSAHEEEAFTTWKKRSQHQWKQDFGEYGRYILPLSSYAPKHQEHEE